MSGLHTSLVKDAHGYTRTQMPWILDEHSSAYGKLIHYIAGGGMKTFGRTVKQEVTRRKQLTFLAVSAVLGVLWLLVYVS